ncbi:EVE domain-containing protein [Bradyrhizobium genomosp. I (2014)]|uniref:EVE domain-containing protein n=1 Tax=Bradyrhizobium genomosp. I (2014) TaxID=2683269 RepID=UPI0004AD4A93|nr:EVE domain-containing protein [Bradyrhizobium sp. CCBAU 43298]
MEERLARIIRGISTFEDLTQFEKNAERRNAIDGEVGQAIKARSAELGRALISERTGLDLKDLTPAEEKIVEAVSEYVGVMKRQGKDATRTFIQLRNRGLTDAAEAAVAKLRPTQGFQALVDADLADLSYEQIIVDHPDEFSARAIWYSRRTLGLPTGSDRPPARAITPVQVRTETLVNWLRSRAESNGGHLPPHTNAEAAATLGLGDLHQFGRAFGNIQSRLDFACYLVGLPPLGLAAVEPFARAWNQRDRSWAFPIQSMQAATLAHVWTARDFERVLGESEGLPGQAHLPWQNELSVNEAKVRAWAYGWQTIEPVSMTEPDEETTARRNPPWSRDELILALDLYLRFRDAPPGKDSAEVAELSAFLGRMGRSSGLTDAETFRNANGVYMKMMNFRRFDPKYTADGRVGLVRGNKEEGVVWNEFSGDSVALATAVAGIHAAVDGAMPSADIGAAPTYWVFVCNPKKWAIDKFLTQNIERDTWGIRPSDRERFAPGQLAIIRVGVDQRSAAERDGNPPLEAGIYALCEVESAAFDGTGASSEFWAAGAERVPGWPTVNIRYLKSYAARPLTIERLRTVRPDVSRLLLNGFQASSFPLTDNDFHAVMSLLGEDLDELAPSPSDNPVADQLAALERKYMNASPEVKVRVSKGIERGPVGDLVKKTNGFKCQVCEALGSNPIGFLKKNGEPYIEAHHVMPVSTKEVGSLSASNVMTVCANHHRQLHYGGIQVHISDNMFEFRIGGTELAVRRLIIEPKPLAMAD